MSWAKYYIQDLEAGKTVRFRPRGPSMKGRIESGQLVTVEPITEKTQLRIGDIVLCKVRGKQYLHLIKGVREGLYLIGNNIGGINGWTSKIYGKVTAVED